MGKYAFGNMCLEQALKPEGRVGAGFQRPARTERTLSLAGSLRESQVTCRQVYHTQIPYKSEVPKRVSEEQNQKGFTGFKPMNTIKASSKVLPHRQFSECLTFVRKCQLWCQGYKRV